MSTTLQARSKIAKRGQLIGLDFDREVESLRSAADWEAELEAVRDPSLHLPAYYTQPFHAYSEGNLCWDAALQVRASLQLCLSRGVRVCLSAVLACHTRSFMLALKASCAGWQPCRDIS